MANAIDAASARMACALAAVTDLVVVSNVNHDQCSMDVNPEDAMSAEKKFSDLGIQDAQMPFLVDALARCCPEDSVRSALRDCCGSCCSESGHGFSHAGKVWKHGLTGCGKSHESLLHCGRAAL